MISYNVFLERDRLPSAEDWARALREGGFDVQLPADFAPRTHSGYLPCPDDRVGFEYYLETFSEPTPEIGEDGARVIGKRNAVVALRFSGRSIDRTAAVAAAGTLAAIADGVLWDGESGHFIASTDALAWARNESYEPVLVQRRRANRRKARLSAPVIVRLLMIAFLVWAIYWLRS